LRKAQQMMIDRKNNKEIIEEKRGVYINDFKDRPPTPIFKHLHIDDDEELIKKREDKTN
jgi:hypothetical protein